MSNFEKAFIYLLMAGMVELMACFMVWLVVSMVGGLLLGVIFFLFDIAFLAHITEADKKEEEERKAQEAWARENDEKTDQ